VTISATDNDTKANIRFSCCDWWHVKHCFIMLLKIYQLIHICF